MCLHLVYKYSAKTIQQIFLLNLVNFSLNMPINCVTKIE